MAIIYTSPHGTIPIPEGQTVWSSLERQAAVNGGKPAFVCGITGRSISFRQAHEQALQICAGLFAHGIKRGDVRTLLSASYEWLTVGTDDWCACLCVFRRPWCCTRSTASSTR
jgi:hypothetical protein